jgi:hypothetical protein
VGVFALKYHSEEAPDDAATGNPDDVLADTDGEQEFRRELNG